MLLSILNRSLNEARALSQDSVRKQNLDILLISLIQMQQKLTKLAASVLFFTDLNSFHLTTLDFLRNISYLMHFYKMFSCNLFFVNIFKE